jgi:hypothetical protein
MSCLYLSCVFILPKLIKEELTFGGQLKNIMVGLVLNRALRNLEKFKLS